MAELKTLEQWLASEEVISIEEYCKLIKVDKSHVCEDTKHYLAFDKGGDLFAYIDVCDDGTLFFDIEGEWDYIDPLHTEKVNEWKAKLYEWCVNMHTLLNS